MMNGREVSSVFRLIFWDKPKRDFLHLLFPSRCILCSEESSSDDPICSFCRSELQYTRFEEYTEPTELDKLFWGRVSVHGTFALLYFHQNSSTKKILHALKYGNKPETGRMLGKEIGEKIKKIDLFKDLDALVPVPIHPKKRFVRGYNQSEELATGISQFTEIPIDNKFIGKLTHTGSQTKQGRFSRWDNVSENFKLRKTGKKYKHILIVDDVITTGATLEAMIRSIAKEHPKLSVSIVSLALTK
jgi:ComF family protein